LKGRNEGRGEGRRDENETRVEGRKKGTDARRKRMKAKSGHRTKVNGQEREVSGTNLIGGQ
jgi:hypothetical protein